MVLSRLSPRLLCFPLYNPLYNWVVVSITGLSVSSPFLATIPVRVWGCARSQSVCDMQKWFKSYGEPSGLTRWKDWRSSSPFVQKAKYKFKVSYWLEGNDEQLLLKSLLCGSAWLWAKTVWLCWCFLSCFQTFVGFFCLQTLSISAQTNNTFTWIVLFSLVRT